MAHSTAGDRDPEVGSEQHSSIAQLHTESMSDPWGDPNSPENPLNWPAPKKNFHVAIVSIFTLTA
jgi:hypothetical protein